MKVFLDRKIILRKDLSNEAIAAYVALRRTSGNTSNTTTYFCINELNYSIRNSLPTVHSYITRMRNGVLELSDKNIIANLKEMKKNEYIADLSTLDIDATSKSFDEHPPFIVISVDDIHRVMNLGTNNDKFSLLRYYCCLMSVINYKKKFGCETIVKLAELSCMARSTIAKYNALFVDKEVIYIGNIDKYMINTNGRVQNIVNHYSRFCDRKAAMNAVAEIEKKKVLLNHTDYNNSLAMKYAYMLKGTKYKYDQVKQIFFYIHGRNESTKKKISETKNKTLKDKMIASLKDETFFKQNYPEFYEIYDKE